MATQIQRGNEADFVPKISKRESWLSHSTPIKHSWGLAAAPPSSWRRWTAGFNSRPAPTPRPPPLPLPWTCRPCWPWGTVSLPVFSIRRGLAGGGISPADGQLFWPKSGAGRQCQRVLQPLRGPAALAATHGGPGLAILPPTGCTATRRQPLPGNSRRKRACMSMP